MTKQPPPKRQETAADGRHAAFQSQLATDNTDAGDGHQADGRTRTGARRRARTAPAEGLGVEMKDDHACMTEGWGKWVKECHVIEGMFGVVYNVSTHMWGEKERPSRCLYSVHKSGPIIWREADVRSEHQLP